MINKNKTLKMAAIGVLLATSNFAAAEGLMAGHKYDLPSGELVTLKGNFFTTKKVECKVRVAGKESNTLDLVSLHNKNIINDLILAESKRTQLSVRMGSKISLEMEQNSELGITNTGDELVNIECA